MRTFGTTFLLLPAMAFIAAIAIWPTSAQAQITVGGPASLRVEETGELLDNSFTALGSALACPGTTYAVEHSGTTVWLSPDFSEATCEAHIPAIGTRPATVDANGCDYVLHFGEEIGGLATTYALTTDIVCPNEKAILMEVFKAASTEHTAEDRVCLLEVGPQEDVSGLHFTRPGASSDGAIVGSLEEVHQSHSGPLCGEGTSTEAQYHLDLAFEEDEEEPETASQLTSNEPVTLAVEQTGALAANSYTSPLGLLSCAGTTYTGHRYDRTPHEFLESGSGVITMTPYYDGVTCNEHVPILGTRPVTIDLNGCDYVLALDEATGEDTFGLTTSVVCPEGKSIAVDTFKSSSTEHQAGERNCRRTIGSQTTSGAHVTNESGDLVIEGSWSIHESHEGPLCGSGEGSMSLDVDLTVQGLNEVENPTEIAVSE